MRPPSTLGYVSYFATWLLFVVFLSLALPGRLAKACAALALIAISSPARVRRCLGLAAGAAVWGGMYWRAHALARRSLWRAAGFAGAALLPGCLYVSPIGTAAAQPRPLVRGRSLGRRAAAAVARQSAHGHCAAARRLRAGDVPSAAFPHYESNALARAYPDFAHESPHNMFLDALVAQGIAGVLLLAAWCVLGFAAAWKLREGIPRSPRAWPPRWRPESSASSSRYSRFPPP